MVIGQTSGTKRISHPEATERLHRPGRNVIAFHGRGLTSSPTFKNTHSNTRVGQQHCQRQANRSAAHDDDVTFDCGHSAPRLFEGSVAL